MAKFKPIDLSYALYQTYSHMQRQSERKGRTNDAKFHGTYALYNLRRSKSFYAYIQIYARLMKGESCSVVTRFKDKYEKDFNNVTGAHISLSLRDGCDDWYDAKLI